ncbi:PREDICTED: endonuclease V-like [Camelina sativa]|uniref:Endonuclease V-like n=1 Tax=Camelina sativa TaxID=90675 RepID=A0ABM0TSW1_CAMSA|nr:PREDICTED: endonuclease V-like [Camelina sativa]
MLKKSVKHSIMVDGNGILHPREFGLACHLGVLSHLPTIGVGKNLHHVDGLNQSEVRLQLKENEYEQVITLVGNSGFTWGVVRFRPTLSSLKPIYISVGHRISLDSAVEIVKMTCNYRVPEPIRQADMRSRAYLQKHQTEPFKSTCTATTGSD